MDTIDLRILRETLQAGPGSSPDLGFRQSFSTIARKLGVDEGTVTNRVKKLFSSGFLKGWSVAINPRLIEQELVQLWVVVSNPTTKAEAIKNIILIPGIAVVKDLYGSTIGLLAYHEGGHTLDRLKQLLSSISGSGAVTSMPVPFEECEMVITEQDLHILRALQKEPLTSYTGLAKKLDLSAKTVKRRILRLCDGGAIYLVAELDPKFLTGGIVGSLLVTYEDAEQKRATSGRIHSLVSDRLMFADLDAPRRDLFALVLTGVTQSRDILDAVQKSKGVVDARLDLVAEVTSLYGVFGEQLERLSKSRHFQSSPASASHKESGPQSAHR